MKKVYCKNCKYINTRTVIESGFRNLGFKCEHPKHKKIRIVDNYYQYSEIEEYKLVLASKKNKKNDCKNYEEK